MPDRRPTPALSVLALAVVALVIWRVAAARHAAPRPVPGGRPAATARPPVATSRDSLGAQVPATTTDSTTDSSTSGPANPMDTVVMNVPGGYFDQLARAQTRRQLRASAGTTYLNEIVAESSDSALHRWDNRVRDPVRVYLAGDTVENYQPAFQDAVRSALARWDAVDLPVRFRYVDDSTRAEVVFRWRRQFDIDRTGQTDLTWDRDGHVLSAVVTIATYDPADHAMGVEDVRVVALHEIGHMLGLNHSSDSTDIMFGHTMARDLSLRDERTATLLYELTPGSVK
ncbi:MAG TPA: matrixin family metalloprotease [Gemmatimonadales bacterium]|jgi:predicted Zn-dependent protease|nr:matrixin family metalloprotease [Gemmatimonadales bacterium]